MTSNFNDMYRLFKGQQKADRGFSLVEVMLGMLLIMAFLGVAMQGMVASTAIKIKSQDRGEATAWIQEDLDFIRSQSNSLDLSGTTYTADKPRCSVTSESTGYADKLRDTIRGSNVTSNTDAANTQTFNRSSSLNARPFTMTRVMSVTNAVPYTTLNVTYTVINSSNTILAQSYGEVIPVAAMSCS
jgi:type II secretory pathway pseudopilin PulG